MGYELPHDPSSTAKKRHDEPADIRGASMPSFRPIDEALLRTIEDVVAPNPSFQTFSTIIEHLGGIESSGSLHDVWSAFASPTSRFNVDSPPQKRDGALVARLPDDVVLSQLSRELDAQVTVSREADEERLACTLTISPRSEALRGIALSFNWIYRVLGSGDRAGLSIVDSNLCLRPCRFPDVDSRSAAVRSALDFFGVAFQSQLFERDDAKCGSPEKAFDLKIMKLRPGRGREGFASEDRMLAPPSKSLRSAANLDCIMCEGSSFDDLSYVFSLASRQMRGGLGESWREGGGENYGSAGRTGHRSGDLFERAASAWLGAASAGESGGGVSDSELRRLAQTIRGIVRLQREISGDRVRYSIDTELDSPPLNGLRVRLSDPDRSVFAAGSCGDEKLLGDERGSMLMCLLAAPGLLPSSRERLMGRLLRNVVSHYSLERADQSNERVIDLGKSSELGARNIRLFFGPGL